MLALCCVINWGKFSQAFCVGFHNFFLYSTYHGRGVVCSRVKVRDGTGWRGPCRVLLVGDYGRDGCMGGCGRDRLDGIVTRWDWRVCESRHPRVRGDLAHTVGGQWCLRR